jgi:hypothetical protein
VAKRLFDIFLLLYMVDEDATVLCYFMHFYDVSLQSVTLFGSEIENWKMCKASMLSFSTPVVAKVPYWHIGCGEDSQTFTS